MTKIIISALSNPPFCCPLPPFAVTLSWFHRPPVAPFLARAAADVNPRTRIPPLLLLRSRGCRRARLGYADDIALFATSKPLEENNSCHKRRSRRYTGYWWPVNSYILFPGRPPSRRLRRVISLLGVRGLRRFTSCGGI